MKTTRQRSAPRVAGWIPGRCGLLGALAVALVVLASCASDAPAGSASNQIAQGIQKARHACARHYRGRRPSALDHQCGPLFDWLLPAHPRPLRGSTAASQAMIDRIMSMGVGGVRPLQLNPEPGHDFGHAVFYSSRSDPVYRVHCVKPAPAACPIEGWRIHIPSRARPADGSDAVMSVLDRPSGREYDFWAVQTVPLPARGGRIVIGWGGRSRIGSWSAGATASCAGAACTPLLPADIRFQDLASQHINHALYLVVGCSNARTVYPASPSGGGGTCEDRTNAPATGQWLQLNMSDAEINALPVSGWQKTIFKAFAHYGAMVGDEGSTGGFEFQLESPRTYTSFGLPNPFVGWAARQIHARRSHIESYRDAGGVTRYALDVGAGVNWASKLRVIDPCVIAGTC